MELIRYYHSSWLSLSTSLLGEHCKTNTVEVWALQSTLPSEISHLLFFPRTRISIIMQIIIHTNPESIHKCLTIIPYSVALLFIKTLIPRILCTIISFNTDSNMLLAQQRKCICDLCWDLRTSKHTSCSFILYRALRGKGVKYRQLPNSENPRYFIEVLSWSTLETAYH